MFEISEKNYMDIHSDKLNEFFTLRKNVFYDRLRWAVKCSQGLEYDEYDNKNATYLTGEIQGKTVCGIRFIDMKNHNMITGTFYKYFDKLILPQGHFVEASRFFVEKMRTSQMGLKNFPTTLLLFLSIIYYAKSYNFEAVYAIVSLPMYMILKRSGWDIKITATGYATEGEKIYLIRMSVDDVSKSALIEKITRRIQCDNKKLNSWPLIIPVKQSADG